MAISLCQTAIPILAVRTAPSRAAKCGPARAPRQPPYTQPGPRAPAVAPVRRRHRRRRLCRRRRRRRRSVAVVVVAAVVVVFSVGRRSRRRRRHPRFVVVRCGPLFPWVWGFAAGWCNPFGPLLMQMHLFVVGMSGPWLGGTIFGPSGRPALRGERRATFPFRVKAFLPRGVTGRTAHPRGGNAEVEATRRASRGHLWPWGLKVCPSVRPSLRLSVRPSVRPSVRSSVRPSLLKPPHHHHTTVTS